VISAELAAFVESGISTQVGTRDADLHPEILRAVGSRVEAGREEVTVFVPGATGGRTLANLRDNGRIAVIYSRATDHRSMQLKGRVLGIVEATERDRPCVERYVSALAEQLAVIGLPPRLLHRIARWPCHAVRFRVEAVFVQTPGPGAGAPLGSGAEATR